jgi:hypothetical protein
MDDVMHSHIFDMQLIVKQVSGYMFPIGDSGSGISKALIMALHSDGLVGW